MTVKITVEAPADKDALVQDISVNHRDEDIRVLAGTARVFYLWKRDHRIIVTETERQFDHAIGNKTSAVENKTNACNE